MEPVIVETLNGTSHFSKEKPGIRYCSPSSDSPECHAHDTSAVKTVSAFAIHGRANAYTNVALTAESDGLLESFEVAGDEIDRMDGVMNKPAVLEYSAFNDDEESEALQSRRRNEVEANMIHADCDEQTFAADRNGCEWSPTVRLMDRARYQELRSKDSSKYCTT
jgi:hypothetical protein